MQCEGVLEVGSLMLLLLIGHFEAAAFSFFNFSGVAFLLRVALLRVLAFSSGEHELFRVVCHTGIGQQFHCCHQFCAIGFFRE
jgi:hypothetical protein